MTHQNNPAATTTDNQITIRLHNPASSRDPLKARADRIASIRSRLTSRPYAIKNPAGPIAELRIYDEIWWGGVNADDLASDLEQITAPEILVAINSPGGDVFDAIAIYNALRAHPAKITTRVDGIAASAASVIVQAGERRIMMSGAQMMIHEPWGGVVGPASDIRDFADLLDKQTEVLARIYASRARQDAAHFKDVMRGGSDVWLDDEETLAEGLADEIHNPDEDVETNPQNTLNDELREVVDTISGGLKSVERVAALRAEKGKTLSKVNVEIVDAIRDHLQRLEALLTPAGEPAHDEEFQRELLRFLRSA